MQKSYNYSFLLLKLLMCILIVGIHSFPLSKINSLWQFIIFQGVSRIGVPIFFLISAYLLFSKRDNNISTLKIYIKRIVLLMISWSIFTLPYIIYLQIIVPYKENLDFELTLKLFLKQTLFSPRFNGFWYLHACIICSILIFMLQGKIGNRILIIFSYIMQVICIVTSVYGRLLPNSIKEFIISAQQDIILYNSFLVGMIYFVIGKYIAETKIDKLFGFRYRKVSFMISLVLLLLEIILVNKNQTYLATDCYFMLVPISYFIMLNVIDGKLEEVKFLNFFKAATTVIYVSQFEIIYILQGIEKRLPFNVNSWVIYICTLILTFIITVIIKYLEKYISFFKYMY